MSLQGSSHHTRGSIDSTRTEDEGGGSSARKYLSDKFEPGQNDVLCGRGNVCTKHPGNLKLADFVKTFIPQYTRADGGKRTKREKSVILTQVVNRVRKNCEPEGGFVKRDPSTGKWYEVGDFLAREKVSQAFRDCLHENYKSSCASKSKRRKEELRRPGMVLGDRSSTLAAASAMTDLARTSSGGTSNTGEGALPPSAISSHPSMDPNRGLSQASLLSPSPVDVVCGGPFAQSHPGNVQFRATVESLVLLFAQAGEAETDNKTRIIDLVLAQVCQAGGRLLRWQAGKWRILDAAEMREEVRLAFTDSLALHRQQEEVMKQHSEKTTLLPESFKPGENDVICGGGKKENKEETKKHAGNIKFQAIVQGLLPTYSRSLHDVHGKTHVLLLVLDQVQRAGGKFLRWKKDSKRWEELGLAGTRQEAMDAFAQLMLTQQNSLASSMSPSSAKKRLHDDISTSAGLLASPVGSGRDLVSSRASLGIMGGLPPTSVASLGGDAAMLMELQQLRRERTLLAAAAGHPTSSSLMASRSALAASAAALSEQKQHMRERAIIAEAEAAAAAAYKGSQSIASSFPGGPPFGASPLLVQQAQSGLPPYLYRGGPSAATQPRFEYATAHSSQPAVVVQQTPGMEYAAFAGHHAATAGHLPPSVYLQSGPGSVGHSALMNPHYPHPSMPTFPGSTTVVYYQPGTSPPMPAGPPSLTSPTGGQRVLVVLPPAGGAGGSPAPAHAPVRS